MQATFQQTRRLASLSIRAAFWLLLLWPLLLWSADAASAELTLQIARDEGGRQSAGNVASLERYLVAQGCSVGITADTGDVPPDLMFTGKPLALSLDADIRMQRYMPLVAVRTWQGYPLTSAILVKASTGLTDLQGVSGQRIAYISESAYLGRQVAEQLLDARQVIPTAHRVYLTGGYEGSMTMLLHGDVFAAVIAGPLARRWAAANDLSILAESKPQPVGYLWVHQEVSEQAKADCKKAFLTLQRTSRRDKRMKPFPLWVEGFEPPTVH